MHIVTGGAGFIGSAMVWKLNQMGVDNILVVDELASDTKWKNLRGLQFNDLISPEDLIELMVSGGGLPETTKAIIHMGACSSTTETNADYLLNNNFNYTRTLTEFAVEKNIRLLVASSGATYGNGEHGYSDDTTILGKLLPLNMYGYSKLLFDQWAHRTGTLKNIASLRFFNVYGPNEYHKGDMASMVFKSFNRVMDEGKLSLFRSHRPDYQDGEQVRDFVYIKDIVDCMWWLLLHPETNGIYNLGTGIAESWNTLAHAVFNAAGKTPAIDYVDMPPSIRNQYQYHTRADITRIRQAGYDGKFRPVADGVKDYIQNHLMRENPYINNADMEK
jgi:ADP-L-glycero-D-manno-heptose-6-epimerase